MSAYTPWSRRFSRRTLSKGVGFLLLPLTLQAHAAAGEDAAVVDHFNYLSTHGNSNCSTVFLESIATMPGAARLQGSCCSPMDLNRYVSQIQGLTKYRAISEVPADPYDIAATLAQKLMGYYELELTPNEQVAYQYAMDNSDEKGPCCCQCWRWRVFGGLAKYLIREHRFTGEQIAEIWDLSDGCGGGAEPHHS